MHNISRGDDTMDKKPLFKVDYSKAEIPFEFRVKQRDCKCKNNLDFHNDILLEDDGSRTFVTFVVCLDCFKQRQYSMNTDRF